MDQEIEVTALVRDEFGYPVSNEMVSWSLSSGTRALYSWYQPLTNEEGIASIKLISDAGETVTVTGTALGAADNENVTFTAAGSAASISITSPLSGDTWSRGQNKSMEGEFTPGTGHSAPYAVRLLFLLYGSGGVAQRITIDNSFSATFSSTPSPWGPKTWTVPNNLTPASWILQAQLKTDGGTLRQPGARINAGVN